MIWRALQSLPHPRLLLRGNEVGPNSVGLTDGVRALVVSGPDAGGKTITLTAVGLCALMLRAGLPIPASSGSRLSLYRSIHSTASNAQDLAVELSTFSTHLAELCKIVKVLALGSLLLIDDIAAVTNPREALRSRWRSSRMGLREVRWLW